METASKFVKGQFVIGGRATKDFPNRFFYVYNGMKLGKYKVIELANYRNVKPSSSNPWYLYLPIFSEGCLTCKTPCTLECFTKTEGFQKLLKNVEAVDFEVGKKLASRIVEVCNRDGLYKKAEWLMNMKKFYNI